MIWFFIVPVAAFFIFKELWFGEWAMTDGAIEFIGSFVFGGVFTLFVAGLCAGAAVLIGLAFDTHSVEISRSKLVSIRDKDGISGTFFLGTGQIGSDQYYFYYEQRQDGGFRPGKVKSNDGVRVYEEARQDAELVTFTWELNKSWAKWVALPINRGGYVYDFHVPQGTIRTGFTM
jgi:hypothetical protein